MEARHDIIPATEQEYVKLRAAIDGLGEAQMGELWLGTYDDVTPRRSSTGEDARGAEGRAR